MAMRLTDAMSALEPTWAEGVAVVQAVCAQLGPRETPPAAGDIVLSLSGAVSFPLGGIADLDASIQGVARLLAFVVRGGGCPVAIAKAIELAQYSPMTFASVKGFGAALAVVPAERGPRALAAYFWQARALVTDARGRTSRSHAAASGGARRPAYWSNPSPTPPGLYFPDKSTDTPL